MLQVVAIGIIGKDNRPLIIRTKYDYNPGQNDSLVEPEAEKLKLHLLLYSCLDFMDETGTKAPGSTSSVAARDPFMGLLTQMDQYRIYGLMSTTRTRVMLIITIPSGQVVRDSDAKHLLKDIYSCYIETTTLNPFHFPGDQVVSNKFDSKLKQMFVKL